MMYLLSRLSATEVCLVAGALDASRIDIPRYTALSYTWGQPDDGKALTTNGQRLHIRSNVHKFFTYVGLIFRSCSGSMLSASTKMPSRSVANRLT